MEKLWKIFENLCEISHRHAMKIAIEWPRNNMYWKLPRVRALIEKYFLLPAKFDGCAIGLKSIRGTPPALVDYDQQ